MTAYTLTEDQWNLRRRFAEDPLYVGDVQRTVNGVPAPLPLIPPEVWYGDDTKSIPYADIANFGKPFIEAQHPRGGHGEFIRKFGGDIQHALARAEEIVRDRSEASYGDKAGHDGIFQDIVDATDRHDAPQVAASSEEFDRLTQGRRTYWRGMTRTEYAHAFLHGDDFYVGFGMHGSGSYFAESRHTAEMYAQMRKDKRVGRTIRVALKPDARVINYRQAEKAAAKDSRRLLAGLPLDLSANLTPEQVRQKAVYLTLVDPGRWAAINGYDAIEDDAHGNIVVLNRGALIADPEIYEPQTVKAVKAQVHVQSYWRDGHLVHAYEQGRRNIDSLEEMTQHLPSLAWKEPPPPKATGATPGGYSATGKTNTEIGDMAEALISKLGPLMSLLPEGKRQNPLDVAWNHSGWGFEVKCITTNAKRYKPGLKKHEVESKINYARENGFRPGMIIAVLDLDAGEIHAYWKDGIGSSELSERTGWNYMGTASVH